MKIRRATAAFAILILAGALIWFWPRSGASLPAPAGGDAAAGGIAGDRPAETPGGNASEGATANQRFRATQRPEPRSYIKPEPEPEPYPVAAAVEGTPGFVISPYNDKVIDVRHMPPGTLVADPTFPASEKRFFRVPDQ